MTPPPVPRYHIRTHLMTPTSPPPHRLMRILSGLQSLTATPPEPTPDDEAIYFNSEFILFFGLFVIVCFLFRLIGLNAASRCSRTRWLSQTVIATNTNRIDHFLLPAAKLLRNIPKLTYSEDTMAKRFSDCAICSSEFVVGDEMIVLPPCGQCFHVECINRWIGSHFRCPSCREMLLKTMSSVEVHLMRMFLSMN